MRLRLLSEDLNSLSADIQEALLKEMPHGLFAGHIDNHELTELLFSGSFLDLGWDDLAEAHHKDFNAFTRQLAGVGYRIPGTSCRMRSPHYGMFALGPSEGTEPELPADWLEFLQIVDFKRPDDNCIIWYGKQVRAERKAIDPENFEEVKHGFKRVR